MPAAVVTLQPSMVPGVVKGGYVCAATPAATNIVLGFVPSMVMLWNATDCNQFAIWSTLMANGTGLKNNAGTQAVISSGGITPYSGAYDSAGAPTLGLGFTVGTDAGVQEASKTFEFVAYR